MPPKRQDSLPKKINPVSVMSSENGIISPPVKMRSPPITSPPLKNLVSKIEPNLSQKTEVSSPPSAFKITKADSKLDDNLSAPKAIKKETVITKEVPIKTEKLSVITNELIVDKDITKNNVTPINTSQEIAAVAGDCDKAKPSEESNGVGDKIKKFEKAAEDASVSAGRLSRAGSARGRPRSDRLGSDTKEDLPPPATPFKDNVHFDLPNSYKCAPEAQVNNSASGDRQHNIKNSPNLLATKWQRSIDSQCVDPIIKRPEPQKIIKPELKQMPAPIDATIRSPSLGTKLGEQFPSHGTAFRNVHKPADDVNTLNHLKTCKFKSDKKYSVSKGSSYFTRGSEEIWLVKKKDIEEIEERVLDSFRRAGGNICMRSESMRPSSDSGQSAAFSHATMGRTKRQMYTRSESLDPQWAGGRAQTLKRQSSVACTCGHDKKTRAKSAGAETPLRPRSRSHGDDNNQSHVLDKYETLV